MDTGEHGKHKPLLQSIYNTMKCTWGWSAGGKASCPHWGHIS